jgi:uncharacterized surface protein with fasciclin (FAS1) repeats
MSAIGPYSQAYNNTHMWDFSDLRSRTKPEPCIDKNTAFYYISSHPEMKKFTAIILKAGMEGEMSQSEFNTTIFVPLDKYLSDSLSEYKKLDRGTARNILAVSMLNNKINGNLIRSSPVSSFMTKDPYNSNYMYITNISGTTEINQCAKVIKYDVQLGNSIIHITDNIIAPTYNHFIY